MWVALIFAAIAGAGIAVMLHSQKRLASLASAPTISCAEVTRYAKDGIDRCEVIGQAAAGPKGLLQAPVSGEPCVWHRVTVEERYRERDIDGTGDTERTRTISDQFSNAAIAVKDPTGAVLVNVSDANVGWPQQSAQTADTNVAGNLGISIGGLNLGFGSGSAYITTEWIVPEGQQLFVSGRPVMVDQQAGFTKPNDGDLLVSTRTEAQLTTRIQRFVYLGYGLIAAGVIGAVVALTAF